MNLIDILREVEADIEAIGTMSGDIRDKVKAGLTELGGIRAEVVAKVEGVVASARASLDGLKAAAAGPEPVGEPSSVAPAGADPIDPAHPDAVAAG